MPVTTNTILCGIAILLFTSSCIQDDFIDDFREPDLRITNTVDTIALDSTYQFSSRYLNNVGIPEQVSVVWSSSDPSVLQIDQNGLALAFQFGSVYISAKYNNGVNLLSDSVFVSVGQMTSSVPVTRSGMIITTSSYALTGSFELKENNGNLKLDFFNDYNASTALPGLYVYLTNNKNSIATAYEIGSVQTFSGSHTYTIPNVGIYDYDFLVYYCKPFNVKVGDGQIQ